MSELKLFLLGAPRVEMKKKPVEIRRRKALALLVYLAVTGQTHSRDTLATLFWPDHNQSRARAYLRRDLAALNEALTGTWFDADRESIGLNRDANIWLDVQQFHQLLSDCQTHNHPPDTLCPECLSSLTAAVTLYQADFLAGFTLRDTPDFDEWQFFQAEGLRQELAVALERLVEGHTAQRDFEAALPYARRRLELDLLHEPAHRELMKLYTWTGQHAAALRQYDECTRLLDEELGVPPETETTELFKAIKTKQLSPPTATKVQQSTITKTDSTSPSDSPAPRHNLPPQSTPFIGREDELADIRRLLEDPNCRMLTVIGHGGIGKTRLTIEVARSLIDALSDKTKFAHAVFFVPLASISSPDHLVPTIADALNFTFYSNVDQKVQLLDHLREKEMLLMLDNFDHLLAGVDLVSDILAAAPAIKILVTSREALNLQGEWVFPVEGLSIPDGELVDRQDVASLEAYGAVQLFMQSARRVRRDFSLAQEQECVIRICRLVGGMPLGIELAAAWLKVFPCAKIAQEIEHNLDFLTTSLRNVPARHRSMRAVFEYSWQLLDDQERDVLRRLSVFRGGFRQEAAEQIAKATLMELATLAEKSLLHVTPTGRYQIHDLLRQFSAEKLVADPLDQEKTQQRHCQYFMRFLKQRQETITGQQQKVVLSEIRQEIENVRIAWNRAIGQPRVDPINQGLETLYHFYWTRSRFQEGEQAFRAAVKHLQEPGALRHSDEIVLLKSLNRQGAFCVALGLYGLARELLQKSLSAARRLDERHEMAFSLNLLGSVFSVQEGYPEAINLYEESLAIYKGIEDSLGVASVLYGLGRDAMIRGTYVKAKRFFQESLARYRAVDHQTGIAHALDTLGVTAFFLGEYPQSEQFYQESLSLFREVGDRLGISQTLGGLGLVAWGYGGPQLVEARRLFEEALTLTRETGHQLEVSYRLNSLGHIANSMEAYSEAQQYFQEALVIANNMGYTQGAPWSLGGLGGAAVGQGDFQAAKAYLHEAIGSAMDSRDPLMTLIALFYLAILLVKEGDSAARSTSSDKEDLIKRKKNEQALEILVLVINHPATWHVFRDKAIHLLAELEAELPPALVVAAQARGKSKRLEDLAVEILGEQ